MEHINNFIGSKNGEISINEKTENTEENKPADNGFYEEEVSGDGNFLPRAILKYADINDNQHHKKLRYEIAEEIKNFNWSKEILEGLG